MKMLKSALLVAALMSVAGAVRAESPLPLPMAASPEAVGLSSLQLSDPRRAMTVQDLLRHTSGLTYGSRGTTLVNASYIDAKIGDRSFTVEQMVSNLSKLALKFNPGDRWEYSVAVDVQGRLLEV